MFRDRALLNPGFSFDVGSRTLSSTVQLLELVIGDHSLSMLGYIMVDDRRAPTVTSDFSICCPKHDVLKQQYSTSWR